MTGVELPPLDFSRLGENVTAFRLLIEIHYRHYLFYSNVALATAISYVCYRIKHHELSLIPFDIAFILLEVILLAASRDTLRNYYSRASQLLGLRSVDTASMAIAENDQPSQGSSMRPRPATEPYSSASRSTKSMSVRP